MNLDEPGWFLSASQLPSLPYSLFFTLLSRHLRLAESHPPTVNPWPHLLLQVALDFSSKEEVPGSKVSLDLKAAPGSLCSVQSVDKSVLLTWNNTLTAYTVSAASHGHPHYVCLPSISMHWQEDPERRKPLVLTGHSVLRWLLWYSSSWASSEQLCVVRVPSASALHCGPVWRVVELHTTAEVGGESSFKEMLVRTA